mgnify:CR=1 FL=1
MILTCPFPTIERLTLIRQQRAEAAKKREEEKAGMCLYLLEASLLEL